MWAPQEFVGRHGLVEMSAAAGEDPSQREDVVSQILPPQRRKSAETEPGAFTVRQQVLAKRFERSALFSADPCGDAALARPTAKSPARSRSLPPDLLPLARELVVARECEARLRRALGAARAAQGEDRRAEEPRALPVAALGDHRGARGEDRDARARARRAGHALAATRGRRRRRARGQPRAAAAAATRSRSQRSRAEPLHEARELADDVQCCGAPTSSLGASPYREDEPECALAPLRAVLRWFNSMS